MLKVLKRGGIFFGFKFVIGVLIGIFIGKLFGMDGVFGLIILVVISVVINSNGSIYFLLMILYGDEIDCVIMSLFILNDGLFFILIVFGILGFVNVLLLLLLVVIVLIFVGMIIGNFDKKMKEFLELGCNLFVFFVGFVFGSSINFVSILKGGLLGVLFGLIFVFVGGIFIVFCDKFIGKCLGYVGWVVVIIVGNVIVVFVVVVLVDLLW